MSFNVAQGAGGLGQLASGILGLFQQNPYSQGMNYLNQVPGQLQQTLGPYNQFGKNAGNQLQNQLGQLLNNPGALLQQFGQGYQQSPGYQFNVNQALGAANRAAAAGGMAGSPQEQAQLASTVSGLANQDYQQYLNNILGLYSGGLNVGENMLGVGAGAANQLAQGLQSNLTNQAQLGVNQGAWKNAQQQNAVGGIAGGVGDLLAAFGF
jgi:hypothetical protein